MGRKWILGEDVHEEDNMLDPITFNQLIVALKCNSKIITRNTVRNLAKQMIEMRMQDFDYLLGNNIDKIILEAERKE